MNLVLVKIEALCDYCGWSLSEMARRAGLHPSTVHRWYQNDSFPSISSIVRVCEAFDISLAQFFSERPIEEICLRKDYSFLKALDNLEEEQRSYFYEYLKSL